MFQLFRLYRVVALPFILVGYLIQSGWKFDTLAVLMVVVWFWSYTKWRRVRNEKLLKKTFRQ
ncbi:hypothetical protein [Alicyclobacillus macrosporangiidus]|uniref:Uncharacterized protein n=1 Tax=Alicyclobacillus macrosporangiidus TaxID=392015 RepID=A0A1I7L1T0_9BACL|nr:hypothetical protein [Alicyclobacillus macrosporangiidus]SFV03578.1 hypothetical protein SAMN05421543_1233 [Alicyclobacillus macrosporangiidus]